MAFHFITIPPAGSYPRCRVQIKSTLMPGLDTTLSGVAEIVIGPCERIYGWCGKGLATAGTLHKHVKDHTYLESKLQLDMCKAHLQDRLATGARLSITCDHETKLKARRHLRG